MPDEFFIAVDGKKKGPYSRQQLRSMWDRGVITSATQYWNEAQNDWYLVSDLLETDTDSKSGNALIAAGNSVSTYSGAEKVSPKRSPLWPKVVALLVVLAFTPLSYHVGFLKTIRQMISAAIAWILPHSDDQKVADMVQWYTQSDINRILFSKSDAERLARAAITVDPDDPESTFRAVALELSDLGLYGKHLLAEGGRKDISAEEEKWVDDAMTLFHRRYGYAESMRLVRILNAMSPHDGATTDSTTLPQAELAGEAKREQQSTPQPSVPTQFATITQPIPVRTEGFGIVTIPAGTHVEIVVQQGANLRIKYGSSEYWLPLSATDLK